MSRNYDLLYRVNQFQDLFRTEGQTAGASVGPTPAADEHLQGMTREEEFKLVQRAFLTASVPGRRTVLFAAVERHDGSPAICARAAEILAAQVKGSVCLVDANLRDPTLHRCFQREARVGLADLLRNGGRATTSVLQQVRDNLRLLPAGSPVAEPQTLFASDRVRQLLQDLRERFDYVLINAPPIGQCAEALHVSQLTEGVVLIVEAHSTHRERARSAKHRLDDARVPVLGVVLSNRTFPIPDMVYRRL